MKINLEIFNLKVYRQWMTGSSFKCCRQMLMMSHTVRNQLCLVHIPPANHYVPKNKCKERVKTQ